LATVATYRVFLGNMARPVVTGRMAEGYGSKAELKSVELGSWGDLRFRIQVHL
jgi:hypothetical protein